MVYTSRLSFQLQGERRRRAKVKRRRGFDLKDRPITPTPDQEGSKPVTDVAHGRLDRPVCRQAFASRRPVSAFALIAVILPYSEFPASGLFGRSRGRNELGVRLALGRRSPRTLKIWVADAEWRWCNGLGLGLIGAIASTRVDSLTTAYAV